MPCNVVDCRYPGDDLPLPIAHRLVVGIRYPVNQFLVLMIQPCYPCPEHTTLHCGRLDITQQLIVVPVPSWWNCANLRRYNCPHYLWRWFKVGLIIGQLLIGIVIFILPRAHTIASCYSHYLGDVYDRLPTLHSYCAYLLTLWPRADGGTVRW